MAGTSIQTSRPTHEGIFKIASSPRVTRVGRPLRRGALDEITQLLNIARGKMRSLVGPRSLVINENRRIDG
jgi:lipopolysaccharide/colanic/teichoic acid biosynthesis glycosyltransferase